jgi:hypothetical protein
MNSAPNSPPRRLGCAKIFFIFISFFSLICCIVSAPNLLSIPGAILSAFTGLLQFDSVREFTDRAASFIDQHGGKISKGIWREVIKAWKSPARILVVILFGFEIVNPPFPGLAHNITYTSCISYHISLCGNGIYVTPMSVDEGKNNRHIISTTNIGIIDTTDKGPFNQYDATNNDVEHILESRIFAENRDCHRSSYVTLIVAVSLSQTVADPGVSLNVGLDGLRGASMAQYNFNHAPSQDTCLHLLIANFGTKGAVSTTVHQLMQQVALYADSDPQHFLGVVGFPFSVSVTEALYERSSSSIPIVSSAAVADSFAKYHDAAPPANFSYTNFYRVVSPTLPESKVLVDFLTNHSRNLLAPARVQTVLFQDPGEQYIKSFSDDISKLLSGQDVQVQDYTIGQPDTLNKGIDYIKNYIKGHPCQTAQRCNPIQIVFAGYGDDVNTLKNKMNNATGGVLSQTPIPIIGGGGLYDLGAYTSGNYANLFFTVRASYASINPYSANSDDLPFPSEFQHPSEKPPYNVAFNWEFRKFFGKSYPTSIYGSELAGTNVMLMYDAVHAFLFAQSKSEKEPPPAIAISNHWSDVKFQGVSGWIQFPSSDNNAPHDPMNKPIYVACTDGNANTHIVAEYDTVDSPPPFHVDMHEDELSKCFT